MTLILRYGRSEDSAARPDAALIASTYQKPRHLRLALASIALQQRVAGRFELVIIDDGSTDETFEIIERFAATVDFPVLLTTHRHDGFQIAKCRNEGVAASSAPYLIFVDGDLILPPDFICQHLRRRRRGSVFTGDCYRLTEEASADLDEAAVRSGTYRDRVSAEELARVRQADRRARWHSFVRHRRYPTLFGGNVGISRADYERVNGYDENFRGWGCEDDDLGHRLRRVGIRPHSINRWTCAYHVWHPREPSCPTEWLDGPNVAYYLRRHREYRCLNGLVKCQGPGAARDAQAALPSAA